MAEVLSETRSVEDNAEAYDVRGHKFRYFVCNLIIIHLSKLQFTRKLEVNGRFQGSLYAQRGADIDVCKIATLRRTRYL